MLGKILRFGADFPVRGNDFLEHAGHGLFMYYFQDDHGEELVLVDGTGVGAVFWNWGYVTCTTTRELFTLKKAQADIRHYGRMVTAGIFLDYLSFK